MQQRCESVALSGRLAAKRDCRAAGAWSQPWTTSSAAFDGRLVAFLPGGRTRPAAAPWTGRLILAFRQPLYALRNVDTSPDTRVLAFTLMVALLTGVLFSLAPALQGSKPDLVVALKDNAPGLGRRSRLRNVLVSSQVALSLVLLVVAGVIVR